MGLTQQHREMLTRLYFNLPFDFYSEFREKIKGAFIADVDDTIEKKGGRRLVDLFFYKLGEENKYFKASLPKVSQDIKTMYTTYDPELPVNRIAERARIAGVTRRQVKESAEWAVDEFIKNDLNPALPKFVKEDLPSRGIYFYINSGDFDEVILRLVLRLGLPLHIANYTMITYDSDDENAVVSGMKANMLGRKAYVNENIAQRLGIKQHLMITMSENPKTDPDLPKDVGIGLWVDPEAYGEQSSARIDLWVPKAKERIDYLTPIIDTFIAANVDATIDTEGDERQYNLAVDNIMKNLENLNSGIEKTEKHAIENIANAAKVLLPKIQRHRPSLGDNILYWLKQTTATSNLERQKSFIYKILDIIEVTVPEVYAEELFKKEWS